MNYLPWFNGQIINYLNKFGKVVHTYHPSSWKVEKNGSLRSPLAIYEVWGQCGLLETLFHEKKRKGKRVRKRRREKKERGKGRREGGGKNKQVLRLKASTTLSSFSTIFNLTLLT